MPPRPTILELLLTAAELSGAAWLCAAGWSGASDLLAGVTIGAFISQQARAR